jgi:hypothetical protein
MRKNAFLESIRKEIPISLRVKIKERVEKIIETRKKG